jgi:hypothetical protein
VPVGVHRPQVVGQLAQVLGEIGVRRHGAGPEGVTSHFRQDQGPEDGEHRGSVDEGDIGVPVVGRSAGQGVEIEDELLPVDHGQRGMALGQRAQPAGELDLLPGAQVLAADEHDAMGQEGGSHLGDLGVGDVAQVEPRELGADATGQPAYPDRRHRVRVDCHHLPPGRPPGRVPPGHVPPGHVPHGHIPHGTGPVWEVYGGARGRVRADGNACEQEEGTLGPRAPEAQRDFRPK